MNELTPDKQNANLTLPATASTTETTMKPPISVPSGLNKPKPIPVRLQNQNTGSATGNPRNKCALQPGHSLMDWVRLGNSGCDLAGTKGVIKPVGSDELKKHNTRKDAWLAIRGKVYNVTRYMDFHPGGVDELMKGVGMDATKLFDDVHAWVNYEQLLSKCLIGPLRTNVVLTLGSSSGSGGGVGMMTKDRIKKSLMGNKGPLPSAGIGAFLSPQVVRLAQAPTLTRIDTATTSVPTEIVPRFDWLQNINDLCIIFYTRALCNPGIIVEYDEISNCDIKIVLLIENVLHICNFKLLHDVQWPGVLTKINTDTGKIEVIFKKVLPNIWCNFGQIERRKTSELTECNYIYDVCECERITHDSYAVYLKPRKKIVQQFPIGYHVSISANIDGETITRSYTPVHQKFTPNQTLPSYYVAFLIKSYETGILSSHICNPTSSESGLELSYAKGKSPLQSIKMHKRIAILGAGSGITPMLAILNYALNRLNSELQSMNLLFFNKTEEDIWCRDTLESLDKDDDRFHLTHILSAPSATWTGLVGRMTEELATNLRNTNSSMFSTVCYICGPTPFNDLCSQLLSTAGFQDKNLHFFRG